MSPSGRRPSVLVLSAPSGAGKTTIAHRLVEGWPEYVFSVSATTRPARPGEVDGEDYRFVDRDVFQAMVARDELCEWAEVHGHLYGTPFEGLETAAAQGRHAVLDIDVQGARQVRERLPDSVLVFILPPSADALARRLSRRGTEDVHGMRRRLLAAIAELDAVDEFDYVVVNEDLQNAVDDVRSIVRAHDRRVERLPALTRDVARIREAVDRVLAEHLDHAGD